MAILLSIIAILLALLLNSCSEASSPAGTGGDTDIVGPAGATGLAGQSAYQLWISLGNTGTEQDFLDSLVGKPGQNGHVGTDGFTLVTDEGIAIDGSDGHDGASAYQLWLDAGNSGTEADFLESLEGAAGLDGSDGFDGTDGSDGVNGLDGLSAFELWTVVYPGGTLADFMIFIEGKIGLQGLPGLDGQDGVDGLDGADGIDGADGADGVDGVDGIDGLSGFGDSGSFWDNTIQGYDGLVSTTIDTAHPMYFSDADIANNQGVTIERCTSDAVKPAPYPVTPKSCVTFSNPGVYNVAFSAQLWRTQGGDESVVSIWLRKNGINVADSRTDVTVQANSVKLVAAWNFFVPVECDTECDQYQLMWSYSNQHSNIWWEAATTNPDRPAIPSVILTVNQIK